jgi:hypothetical protein
MKSVANKPFTLLFRVYHKYTKMAQRKREIISFRPHLTCHFAGSLCLAFRQIKRQQNLGFLFTFIAEVEYIKPG